MAQIVKPIEGNLVSIKITALDVAEFAAVENEEFVYTNPRHFKPGRQGIDGEGLDRDSMKELREAIKDRGLFKPLMVRVIEKDGEKAYQIIAGERRWRACKKLFDDNEPCFNPINGKIEPGSEVYATVECRLYEDINDKEAMKMAFLENSTSVNIGEAANLNLFRYWRAHDFDDESIMDFTKKTIAWVRHMDKISALDEETLRAYCGEQINQTVALLLADINNSKQRVKVLHKACEFAGDRARETIEKAREEFGEAVKDAEISRGMLKIAGSDDKEAEGQAAKTAAKASAKRKKVQQAEQQGQARAEDLVKAQIEVTGKPPEAANTALRTLAIQRYIVDEADKLIEADGYSDNGKFIAPVETVEVAKHVAAAIGQGRKDFHEILGEIAPPEDFEEYEE